MSKYLLRFYKRGNMRFISHLDLGRLFRRAIKRGEINVDYSQGFNPHEKINIVQPLSLGFEADSEYFEITTRIDYDPEELRALLNLSMPEDISFYSCRRVNPELGNLSNKSEGATYEVIKTGSREEFEKLNIDAFLNLQSIVIKKRSKKTKQMVDKEVKSFVYSVSKEFIDDTKYLIRLCLRCAANESLNPDNLLVSLFSFSGMEFDSLTARFKRLDILTYDENKEFVTLDSVAYD